VKMNLAVRDHVTGVIDAMVTICWDCNWRFDNEMHTVYGWVNEIAAVLVEMVAID
jgi:UTP:GlnB (protein PII) uridylyltransferase